MSQTHVGAAAVEYVYRQLQIDAEWSLRHDGGFTWWGKDFAQRVTATEPVLDRGCWVSCVTAVTLIVSGVEDRAETHRALSLCNALVGTVSGLVMHDNMVAYAATATVHEQNLPWMQNLVALTVAMQAADGQNAAGVIAKMLGGSPAVSGHPHSGPRPECDDILNVIQGLVVPRGQGPSLWAGEEMARVLGILKQVSLMALGSNEGVTAEFPYGNDSSLLQFRTTLRHPQVGSGVLVTLTLPDAASLDALAVGANWLNGLELGMPLPNFRGAWCVSPGEHLAFTAFYPNAFYRAGLGVNLALQMAERAKWVAKLFDQRTKQELDVKSKGVTPAPRDRTSSLYGRQRPKKGSA